jgi:hypothetical protein
MKRTVLILLVLPLFCSSQTITADLMAHSNGTLQYGKLTSEIYDNKHSYPSKVNRFIECKMGIILCNCIDLEFGINSTFDIFSGLRFKLIVK